MVATLHVYFITLKSTLFTLKITIIYKNNIPGTFEALGAPVHHIVFMLYFRLKNAAKLF